MLKFTFTPILLYCQKIAQKHAVLCLHPEKLLLNFGNSAAPNPKNYKILQLLTRRTTLRRSCFTERRAPSEAWIGGNISGCHCRQSSMRNNIGGARTRMFFKLTNRWRSDSFSVLFWGVFRVEERIELIWHLYKYIGVNESFNLTY